MFSREVKMAEGMHYKMKVLNFSNFQLHPRKPMASRALFALPFLFDALGFRGGFNCSEFKNKLREGMYIQFLYTEQARYYQKPFRAMGIVNCISIVH